MAAAGLVHSHVDAVGCDSFPPASVHVSCRVRLCETWQCAGPYRFVILSVPVVTQPSPPGSHCEVVLHGCTMRFQQHLPATDGRHHYISTICRHVEMEGAS